MLTPAYRSVLAFDGGQRAGEEVPEGMREATADVGVGQVAAVSPEQHSSWLSPNIAQAPSRQAAWPCT
ncbi:MAG TPA: hypothetical protein VIY70_10130 [Acidimicrobiia bacterium]